MVAVLLIAGIALLSAGLVAIGFGIPVKEFSFGNTLIFSGTIVACTGLLMFALWIVLHELRNIARQFGSGIARQPRATAAPATAFGGAPGDQAPNEAGFSFGRDQPVGENPGKERAAQPPGAPPWQDEAAAAGKPRRNLLFSSSSRKERGRAPEPSAADLRAPPLDMMPAAGSADLPPPSFEDAWPKSERSRQPDAPRRGARPPPRFAGGPAARNEDRPAATVLKSGVVDGMAYTLYSDGSIEAQMPEGMMRFASIDELRAHLDQRS